MVATVAVGTHPTGMHFCLQNFHRGSVSMFTVRTGEAFHPIKYLLIWHDKDGDDVDWFLDKVMIYDPLTDKT